MENSGRSSLPKTNSENSVQAPKTEENKASFSSRSESQLPNIHTHPTGSKVGKSQYFDQISDLELRGGNKIQSTDKEKDALKDSKSRSFEDGEGIVLMPTKNQIDQVSSEEGLYQNELENPRSSGTSETVPLIPTEQSRQNRGPDLWFFSKSPMDECCKDKKYPLSAAFTNYDYRQDFVGRIYIYKVVQAIMIASVSIVVQMIWTWNYKLKYGTPMYAQLIVDHFWLGFISLPVYFTVIFVIRTFDVGKNPPLNIILFLILTILLAWSCFGTSVGLFDYLPNAASVSPIVSLAMTLSYAAFCVVFIPKRFPVKIDVTSKRFYHYASMIGLVSCFVSWFIVNGLLLAVGSFYQIQNVSESLFLECFIISMPISILILLYEVRNIQRLIEGSRAALYADDLSETLFAFFFV